MGGAIVSVKLAINARLAGNQTFQCFFLQFFKIYLDGQETSCHFSIEAVELCVLWILKCTYGNHNVPANVAAKAREKYDRAEKSDGTIHTSI